MHIAICAGEISGDHLGAPLITELKNHFPNATFSGVGGEMMLTAGLKPIFSLDRLAVMGLVEVITHLPDLLAAKKELLTFWQQNPPDIFIGIDAPDFNLRIAKVLHQQGIKTVHYVSPSLWAWKEKRIFNIIENIDLMLCLFPFETDIYTSHHVPVVCVGHPLRDRLKPIDKISARKELGLSLARPLLGLFPGSRQSEITRHMPIFLQSFDRLKKAIPDLNAILSIKKDKFLQKNSPDDVTINCGDSALLMAACDVLLLASGTITLEAALLKRPQVVAYRVNPLTAAIARRLLKIDCFALPNLLSHNKIVPECIQENCTPIEIEKALLPLFQKDNLTVEEQLMGFSEIVASLPEKVSLRAAVAIKNLYNQSKF